MFGQRRSKRVALIVGAGSTYDDDWIAVERTRQAREQRLRIVVEPVGIFQFKQERLAQAFGADQCREREQRVFKA